MIVLVKDKLDRPFIVGVLRNRKAEGITYKNILPVKGPMDAKYLPHVSRKPPLRGISGSVLNAGVSL